MNDCNSRISNESSACGLSDHASSSRDDRNEDCEDVQLRFSSHDISTVGVIGETTEHFMDVPLRDYQRIIATNAVTVAKGKGCVVNLPTGAGKTNIAAAIAIHELLDAASRGERKAVVMLVPTRDLVLQQAKVFHTLIVRSEAVISRLSELRMDVVVTFKLGGKNTQIFEVEKSGGNGRYNSDKQCIVFVSTAEVYNTSVQATGSSHIDPTLGTPPLDITTTVFLDEVHHCGKKHPYAIASNTIRSPYQTSSASHFQRPRIVGLSATLSYAVTSLDATIELLTMIDCGSGQFCNGSDDKSKHLQRMFVFAASKAQLKQEGYHAIGEVISLPNSDLTVQPSDKYRIGLKTHELWNEMIRRLRHASQFGSLKEILDADPSNLDNIHPVVVGAFVVAETIEKDIMEISGRGTTIEEKLVNGKRLFTEAADRFFLLFAKADTWSDSVWKHAACDLRFKAMYMHCMQVVYLVTITDQLYLEAAMRAFLMYAPTTLPKSFDVMHQKKFDEIISGCVIPVSTEFAQLFHQINLEVNDDPVLGKFDDLYDLMVQKVKRDTKVIIFAENVAICGIVSDFLNLKKNPHIRSQWYASKSSAPYFNIPHRSLTQQRDTLTDFREGKTNILVGTTVLEEGIDVPNVQVTVHFTPPTNAVSLVQRQGRARAEDSESFSIDATKIHAFTTNRFQHAVVTERAQRLSPTDIPPRSSSIPNYETTQAFDANLTNFKEWLHSREVDVGPTRPASQILNEMTQRLMAKSLGKLTHTYIQLPTNAKQDYKAIVEVEIRKQFNETTTFTVENVSLGKKKAINGAGLEVIERVKRIFGD